jgi:hypothetical protein
MKENAFFRYCRRYHSPCFGYRDCA